jgi:hypothetical protein
MENDRLWMMIVGTGFSLLVLLAYVIATPLVGQENITDQTQKGLQNAIDKFKQLKERNQEPNDLSLDT